MIWIIYLLGAANLWLTHVASIPATTPKAFAHDFHMSKAEVNYNADRQSLEVSLHIFIDDLEMAILQSGADSLYLATSKESPQANRQIEKYIEDHFTITIDGQPIDFSFLGKEESYDLIAFWCYLEGTDIKPPHTLDFRNALLTELFDDQKNLIAFTAPGVRKFYLLDTDTSEATLKL